MTDIINFVSANFLKKKKKRIRLYNKAEHFESKKENARDNVLIKAP